MPRNPKVSRPENDYIERRRAIDLANKAFADVVEGYLADKDRLGNALTDPLKEIQRRQEAHEDMTVADQIAREAGWLIKYTADWKRAESRLDDLKRVLGGSLVIPFEQEDNGSWGPGCSEWYRKLEPTVDELQKFTNAAGLKPLAFMKPLQDAKWAQAYLWRLQISDITATKVNYRDELGSVQSALSQLIFKDGLRELLADPGLAFTVSPELEETYTDFLDQTQHPRTGYWGPWYRFDDELIRVQDLSFTFHVISYRGGDVARWPLIVDTTLDIKELVFPGGWRPSKNVEYNNHNNYDVATIFALGWPHIDRDRKKDVRDAIARMLVWCLTKSIVNDFFVPGDGQLPSDAFYYGARFLDKVGYWDAMKRFWGHNLPALPEDFPRPAKLAENLLKSFETLGAHSSEAETTRSILRMACASRA
jgi:hypothetical protein